MKCGSVRKVIVNDPLRDDSHAIEYRPYSVADDAMLKELADEQIIRYNYGAGGSVYSGRRNNGTSWDALAG